MTDTNNSKSDFQLLLATDRPALVAGTDHRLTVLVRLQAPEPPAGARPRESLHLALVLDRSGSMAGVPLQEARNCARYIVDNLAPNDFATVVAFDDEVECMAPLGPAGDKTTLRAAIAAIESAGSTDLHGGWSAGAAQLAASIANSGVHRVILLSDGNANQGEQDLETISGQCRDRARNGTSTSTYGLGNDFNEDLMLAMAKAGRGNAYYGATAADLAEPFQAEFALLTSLCARGIALKVNAPDDVGVKLLNDFEPVDGEARAWKLPDLAFGAEAWALLEFTLPAARLSTGSTVQLPISIAVQAASEGSTPLFLMAIVPPMYVVTPEAWQASAPNDLVARRMLEIEAGNMLDEVRGFIDHEDWIQAEATLRQAEQRFGQNAWTQGIIVAMRNLVARRDRLIARKEALYSSRVLKSRLSSHDESDDLMCEAVPLFLRRKTEQGKGTPGT
jgi:Ca-activated chloride channel family protein